MAMCCYTLAMTTSTSTHLVLVVMVMVMVMVVVVMVWCDWRRGHDSSSMEGCGIDHSTRSYLARASAEPAAVSCILNLGHM